MGTTTTATTDATTELYWEATGSGPAVLLIAGAPGDGGQMEEVARDLAADHLVITYDRRGTSRSSAPTGWSQTTVAEQAADAAAILTRVGVPPALVFGTSNGALVALDLALRHPGRVGRAVLHEPPLLSVLDDPGPVMAAIGAVVGPAMGAGGPEAAFEAFLRFAFGDAIVDAWAPDLRARMLANGAMVFGVELPAFQAYRPDEGELAACPVPVTVLVGEDQPLPFFHEAAKWLAHQLGTTPATSPGAHGPQFSDPGRLAALLRDLEGRRTV